MKTKYLKSQLCGRYKYDTEILIVANTISLPGITLPCEIKNMFEEKNIQYFFMENKKTSFVQIVSQNIFDEIF